MLKFLGSLFDLLIGVESAFSYFIARLLYFLVRLSGLAIICFFLYFIGMYIYYGITVLIKRIKDKLRKK